MKASREMKNKFSPLTVLLLIILSLYVLFMLVMLFLGTFNRFESLFGGLRSFCVDSWWQTKSYRMA